MPRAGPGGLLLLALAFAIAGTAWSGQMPGPPRSSQILLRLDGTMQASRQRGAYGFTVVSLGLLGSRPATRFLAVDEARTIGGNPGILGKNVLDAVRPYEPDFLVSGPAPLMERLYTAGDGDHVTIEGLVQVAARGFFVREAVVVPREPTTTTVPTSTTLPPP